MLLKGMILIHEEFANPHVVPYVRLQEVYRLYQLYIFIWLVNEEGTHEQKHKQRLIFQIIDFKVFYKLNVLVLIEKGMYFAINLTVFLMFFPVSQYFPDYFQQIEYISCIIFYWLKSFAL